MASEYNASDFQEAVQAVAEFATPEQKESLEAAAAKVESSEEAVARLTLELQDLKDALQMFAIESGQGENFLHLLTICIDQVKRRSGR